MKLRPQAWICAVLFIGAAVGQTAASAGTFPGANGMIVFSSGAVEAINPNGSGRTTLASAPPASRFDEPAWNSTGTEVVFREGGSTFNTMNANGSNSQPLYTSPTVAGNPTWSPGGSVVAYDTGSRIYTVPASGGNATELAAVIAKDPTYSPDGSKIAFEHLGDGAIGVMNSDGTSAVSLDPAGADNDEDPSWSPDGTSIAFQRNDQIWSMNADGSGATQLTSLPEDSVYPTWSPDGTMIAFQSDDDIWVMDADGSGETNITNTPNEDERGPDWGVAPTVHQRSVSLALKRHLQARGKVTVADESGACIANVAVKITRNGKAVAKTTTNGAGAYKVKVKDRPGKYKAIAAELSAAGGICAKVSSPQKRHKH